MRTITFISILSLGLFYSGTPKSAATIPDVNGTWVPVAQEIGGVSLPNTSFEKQTLVINDSMYTFTAESVDKGIIKFTSKTMDIYGKEGVNTGKHFTALYKYENSLLSICYNLSGKGYPESYETKGKPAFFLCIFKKAMP
jgi:uncharacterized protein (TIGR03067 family)